MTERLRRHAMTEALAVAPLRLLAAPSVEASGREQHHDGYTIVERTYRVREQDCPGRPSGLHRVARRWLG